MPIQRGYESDLISPAFETAYAIGYGEQQQRQEALRRAYQQQRRAEQLQRDQMENQLEMFYANLRQRRQESELEAANRVKIQELQNKGYFDTATLRYGTTGGRGVTPSEQVMRGLQGGMLDYTPQQKQAFSDLNRAMQYVSTSPEYTPSQRQAALLKIQGQMAGILNNPGYKLPKPGQSFSQEMERSYWVKNGYMLYPDGKGGVGAVKLPDSNETFNKLVDTIAKNSLKYDENGKPYPLTGDDWQWIYGMANQLNQQVLQGTYAVPEPTTPGQMFTDMPQGGEEVWGPQGGSPITQVAQGAAGAQTPPPTPTPTPTTTPTATAKAEEEPTKKKTRTPTPTKTATKAALERVPMGAPKLPTPPMVPTPSPTPGMASPTPSAYGMEQPSATPEAIPSTPQVQQIFSQVQTGTMRLDSPEFDRLGNKLTPEEKRQLALKLRAAGLI